MPLRGAMNWLNGGFHGYPEMYNPGLAMPMSMSMSMPMMMPMPGAAESRWRNLPRVRMEAHGPLSTRCSSTSRRLIWLTRQSVSRDDDDGG